MQSEHTEGCTRILEVCSGKRTIWGVSSPEEFLIEHMVSPHEHWIELSPSHCLPKEHGVATLSQSGADHVPDCELHDHLDLTRSP